MLRPVNAINIGETERLVCIFGRGTIRAPRFCNKLCRTILAILTTVIRDNLAVKRHSFRLPSLLFPFPTPCPSPLPPLLPSLSSLPFFFLFRLRSSGTLANLRGPRTKYTWRQIYRWTNQKQHRRQCNLLYHSLEPINARRGNFEHVIGFPLRFIVIMRVYRSEWQLSFTTRSTTFANKLVADPVTLPGRKSAQWIPPSHSPPPLLEILPRRNGGREGRASVLRCIR